MRFMEGLQMRLEVNSKRLLAVTKSQAKMYEFNVDEDDHNEIYEDPRKLLTTCIGILGELAHLETRGDGDSDYLDELKDELVNAGQFSDALNHSTLEPGLSDYLLLVGAATYYLAEMPGSSSVLSKQLSYHITRLTPNYLGGLLIWILKSDIDAVRYHLDQCEFKESIDEIVRAFI